MPTSIKEPSQTLVPAGMFAGPGEMARLCREKEWGETPLGAAREWPQSLRTAADLVLASPFPMMLAWGPELVQIYNDGYREFMGDKHPCGLGQRVSVCWAEVWTDVRPLFARAMAGETVRKDDLPLWVDRRGGPEQAFFTFAYSPVRDESGRVAGVLDVAFETTQEVERRRLQDERGRLYRELEVERSRLAFVFQHAPAFLAILRGPDHTFHLANDAYYQLVGHREIEGKPLLEALPEIRGQPFVSLLDGVLESGEPFLGREVPVLLARTPGAPPEERFIDLTYLPLVEPDGTRSGIIAHGTDVSEQVLARREVERLWADSERARADAEAARAEAEAANRGKTDFLSAMSHELRTPLNAIGGYADLIAMGIHGPVTADQRTALGRISAGQQHLLMLINDILSYARLEAGHLDFEIEPLSVGALFAGVGPLIAPQAQARGISLSLEPCTAVQVLADEERAVQVLLNLAGNAIKFTQPGGEVVISCDVDDTWAHLRVCDNGPGIAPQDQARVFDAFRQVDRRLSERREGVGLGLAISRDLALGMAGELSLSSTEGKGSTFTLSLPRASPGMSANAEPPSRKKGGSHAGE